MDRENHKNWLTATRVSLRLQERDKKDDTSFLKLFPDTKLRESVTENILHDSTPYRCSLNRKNGLAATRGNKHNKESTFCARKRLRERELEKASGVTLPKILPVTQNLVTMSAKDASETHTENSRLALKTRSEKKRLGNKNFPYLGSHSSHRTSMDIVYKDLKDSFRVSKTNDGKIREKRAKLYPEKGPQIFLRKCSPRCQEGSYIYDEKFEYSSNDFSCSEDDEENNNFSKTFEDGSKVTASRQRLSIEIFMPKI